MQEGINEHERDSCQYRHRGSLYHTCQDEECCEIAPYGPTLSACTLLTGAINSQFGHKWMVEKKMHVERTMAYGLFFLDLFTWISWSSLIFWPGHVHGGTI